MRRYSVKIGLRARAQLDELRRYIAEQASAYRADVFLDRVEAYLASFEYNPERGETMVRQGRVLRRIGWRRTLTIVIRIEDDVVTIVGVFYGGQRVLIGRGDI